MKARLDVDKAVKLYNQGLSTTAIAERFGVRPGTVCTALKSRGILLNRRVRYDGSGGIAQHGVRGHKVWAGGVVDV